MPDSHLALGKEGEKLARSWLETQGYRIVTFNFVAPIGHSRSGRILTGEIDIIAYDRSLTPPVLAFIEVKTRSSDDLASPESAVDRRKQRQIIRAARVYRRIMALANEPYRYDVVSILATPGSPRSIKLLRNYFRDADHSKSRGKPI